MALFQYTGLDGSGKGVSGTLEAMSRDDALGKLKGMGYFVTHIGTARGSKASEPQKQATKPAAKKKSGGLSMNINIPFIGGGSKIKPKELTVVTRQLATLIGSGLPLLRSLKVLEQQRKGGASRVLARVANEIEQGALFSEALAKFPASFPRIYVAMVKAGEAGGALESVLSRLAEFMEKEAKLRGKIKSAMAYPAVVVVVMIGILTFIMTKIVPTFVKIFEDMEVSGGLPGPTKLLIKISNLMTQRYYLIIAFVFALVILYRILNKIKFTKYLVDKVKLRLFLFGPIISKTIIARFARTFATLITSGVPILQSLQIVRDTVGNEVIAKAINEVRNRVREGEGISGVMLRTAAFPPMVTNMVAVGEETGAMDAMLEKIADAYEAEVDAAVSAMTSMLEPILIVCLGGVVGFIVVSLYMPLIKIALSLSGGPSEGGGKEE